jgi:hypothetical protein
MLEVMDEIYKESNFQELFPAIRYNLYERRHKGFSLLSGLRDLN